MSARLAALALAALSLALLAPAAQADWLGFHGDALKTGYVPFSNYSIFKDVWWNNKTLASAQILASPVLKENILVTADTAGLVRGLDAASGKQLWSFKMPAGVSSTPVIAGEYVYVASQDGTLAELNLGTGGKASAPTQAEYTTGVGANPGSLTEYAGKIFVGNGLGEMRALQASDLSPLWVFSVASVTPDSTTTNNVTTCSGSVSVGAIVGAPAVFDHKVFFGSKNDGLYAVNEAGGGQKPDGTTIPNTQTLVQWYYPTGDLILSTPAIDTHNGEKNVIFTSWDGNVYSFPASPSDEGSDPCYGAHPDPNWTFTVPVILDSASGQTQTSKVESSPAVVGSHIYFGANNGKLYGLNADDISDYWESTAGTPNAPITGSPAVANGVVVVGSQDKNVYWFNATNGKSLRSAFATQSAVFASPAIDGNRAYVASREGTLYAFGPEIPKRADLVVSSVAAAGTALQVTVKNQGDAKAGNTTVRLFVGGTFLANLNVAALDPGQSATVSYPANLGPASVSVKATVDPDNTVAESNDSNNDMTQGVAGQVPATGGSGGGSTPAKKKGLKIPGPEMPLELLALVAVALLATRRRR